LYAGQLVDAVNHSPRFFQQTIMQARGHMASKLMEQRQEQRGTNPAEKPCMSEKEQKKRESLERIRSQEAKYMAGRPQPSNCWYITKQYIRFGDCCFHISRTPAFENFILSIIVTASILSSLETYNRMEGNRFIHLVDNIILAIFTLEAGLKFVGETLRPWMYFIGSVTCRILLSLMGMLALFIC
jgi:hypothetical protein